MGVNLETSRDFYQVYPCQETTYTLFQMALAGNMMDDIPGAFMTFHQLWSTSHVYKIPCGYLRFEPYPSLGAATLHGIIYSNPFRDLSLFEEVLNFYLQTHPMIHRIECHVPKDAFRGLHKLVSSVADESQDVEDRIIYQYGEHHVR